VASQPTKGDSDRSAPPAICSSHSRTRTAPARFGRVVKLAAPCALGLVAAVALVPAARAVRPAHASAASLPFRLGLRVTGNAKERGINLVRVALSAPATASCALQITAEHFEKLFPSPRPGSVVWNWTAPVRAPKGEWTFTARCSEGARWEAYWFKVEMGFPERSGALVAAPPVGTPAASRESCDSQGVCFANDPFPVGQCTWYAAGRRTDLVGIVHGDAWEWLRAARGRVPEGSRPAVGAIAVFPAGTPGGTGHVAYVAAISGSRVLLDDSNWRPTPWSPGLEVHEHWEPASSAGGYIYGGSMSRAR
jgi:surface antigen